MDEAGLRAGIVATYRDLARAGLNSGRSGNVSARFGAGMLITPSGSGAEAEPAELVSVDMDGQARGERAPSSEWRFHRDIYRAHPDAHAVVHAHPPHATALACLRRGLPAFHYMVASAGGRDIRCADYATFGGEALSHNILAALQGRRACLMANHGLVAFGASLPAAFDLAVEVESLARQYLLACGAGEPVLLDDAEMDRVLEKFASYGKD
jgi:L-fuculose-phosphate aldolase